MLRLSNKYFPIMTKQVSTKRLNSPWMTDIVMRCVNKKHIWFRLLKRNRITKESYDDYCNALRNMLRIAEEDYYSSRLHSLGNDQKRNWEVLNNLLGKQKCDMPDSFKIGNSVTHSTVEIASAFSEYFFNHPLSVYQNIPPASSDFLHLIPLSDRSMDFYYSCEDEFLRAISIMKTSNSLDDIPSLVLKLCKHKLSKYLSELFNLCIDRKDFPGIFKISRITPVHKKGPRNIIENYRPICVLPNISKLFDHLIHTRIQNFFTCNDFLSDNQYGFRKNKNTELAILELVHKIIPSIESKSFCICIFLDYKACFDTISRDMLVRKLERYGLHGVGLGLVRAYFADRYQYVCYQKQKSPLSPQNLGVIQGSKTGPLYFDIYSNEFCRLLGDNQYVLYADDTSIAYVGESLPDLVNYVNQKLSIISD